MPDKLKFKDLKPSSSADDFIEAGTGQDERIDQLEEGYNQLNEIQVKMLEQSVRFRDPDPVKLPGDERANKLFRAVYQKDIDSIYKYGGRFIKEADHDWKGEEWMMGNAAQKSALGSYYLRGKKIASLIGNGEMNSSQIQGSLNLIDMVILSQALNEGRCRDLTGAILN